MKKRIKKVLFYLISLYLLFPFYIKVIAPFMSLAYYGLICAILILKFKRAKEVILQSKLTKSSFFLFIVLNILYFSIILLTSARNMDITFAKEFVGNLVIQVKFFDIFLLFDDVYDNKYDKLYAFPKVVIIYIITTCIFLLFPNFRLFWMDFIVQSEKNLEDAEIIRYITRFGLQGYSGYVCANITSLAMIVISYLIINKKEFNKNFGSMITSALFILIGSFFYGRVALAVNFVIIFFTFLYMIFVQKDIKMLFVSLVLSFLVLVFFILGINAEKGSPFYLWFNWVLEPVLNFLDGKGFSSASTDSLKEMIYIPEEMTFIFGDGYYTDPVSGGYYKHTDSGIMRPLLYYGFFGIVLFYFLTFLLFSLLFTLKNISKTKLFFLFFVFSFSFIIYEIKGSVYTQFYGCLLYFIGCLMENNKYRKEIKYGKNFHYLKTY